MKISLCRYVLVLLIAPVIGNTASGQAKEFGQWEAHKQTPFAAAASQSSQPAEWIDTTRWRTVNATHVPPTSEQSRSQVSRIVQVSREHSDRKAAEATRQDRGQLEDERSTSPMTRLAAIELDPALVVKPISSKDEVADTKTVSEKAESPPAVSNSQPEYFYGVMDENVVWWTASADAFFLKRERSESVPLIFDRVSGARVFDADGLEFQHEGNPRFTLTRHRCNGWDAQFVYFGIEDLSSSRTLSGDLALGGPGFNLAINPAGFVVDLESELHNFELNFRREINDLVTFRAGARWMQFKDRLFVRERTVPIASALDISTRNDLIGGQVGCDVLLINLEDEFQISGSLGFGAFHNTADQRISTSFLGPAIDDGGSRTALLGEIGISATYRMTDHCTLRLGYQWMMIDGLALAPEQIADSSLATNTARLKSDDSLWFYGANIGLEIAW